MIDSQRLRQLREAHGYTREQFAKKIDLGIAQLTRYERGESDATTEVLARIATVLGVSSDYLIGLSDDPIPKDSEIHTDELALIAARRRGELSEAIKLLVPDD